MDQEIFSLGERRAKLNDRRDLEPHVERMQKMKVVALTTRGNTLGVEASQYLAEAIKTLDHLESVDLSDSFTGRSKDEVLQSLTVLLDALRNKKIKEINLSDNAIGINVAPPIASYLSDAVFLERLYMNNNGLGETGCEIIVKGLVELASKGGQRLTTISLGRNLLQTNGAYQIARTIELFSNTLTNISLHHNSIRDEGITSICEALSKCRNLETLELQGNVFMSKSADSFSKAIGSWDAIKTINLSDSFLDSQSLSKTIDGFKKCPRLMLESLDLQYNEIGGDELSVLLELIPHYKNIRSLCLNGNCFDPKKEDYTRFVEGLKEHGLDQILDEIVEFDELESEEEELSEDSLSSNNPEARIKFEQILEEMSSSFQEIHI